MQIGAISSFRTVKSNNVSFKGWERKTIQRQEPASTRWDASSNRDIVVREARTVDVTVNEYWKDAVGEEKNIKKYVEDQTTKRPIDHINAMSSLLEQRAITLNEKAANYKNASIECAQEAKSLKEEAISMKKSTLQEQIAKKKAEMEALAKELEELNQ